MKKIHMFLLIAWILIIFIFSNETGMKSTDRSEKIASTIVSDNNVDKNQDTNNNIVLKYELVIRKVAHLLEYIILGLLAVITIKDYKKLNFKICLFILLGTFLYACSDEMHQHFIPGRDSSYIDVLIDTIGSFIGIFGYYIIHMTKEKRKIY